MDEGGNVKWVLKKVGKLYFIFWMFLCFYVIFNFYGVLGVINDV